MVTHPDVFRKAQSEVDQVVGQGRLPDFDDRLSLPYLDKILKELYRWNPPLPLAFPHSLMEDDEYHGYRIPKGTMILPNIWAMTHDENIHSNPEDFIPERFDEMDNLTAASKDPHKTVFGFGRRVCPGEKFADISIWLAIASILAVFDISTERDSSNSPIIPPVSFQPGITSYPVDFKCRIVPRSSEVVNMLSEMTQDADAGY